MSLYGHNDVSRRQTSQIPPLLKLLSMFSLCHYAPRLSKLGYTNNIHSLAYFPESQLEHFYKILGLTQEEKNKFREMLNLIVMLHESNSGKRTSSVEPTHVHRRKFRRLSNSGDEDNSDIDLAKNIDFCSEKFEEEKVQTVERNKIIAQIEEARKKIGLMTEELIAEQKNAKLAIEIEEDKQIKAKIVKERADTANSYDSSKLRSTLAHIDVEEICHCLAKSLFQIISFSKKKKEITENNSDKSKLQKFCENELLSFKSENTELKIPFEIAELFNKEFDDPSPSGAVSETDIYYFCKNVIFRARMEKECSIICLIYIERLIKATGISYNERNWKKLAFIALIIASKVWSDMSYENFHFSKLFTIISLREINSLERLFLNLIDFNVNIEKSLYAKYYFILRTYAEKNKRTFHLKPLDVETVRKLQQNANHAQDMLKELHSQSLLKTT
ncbi:unnamed protein product [Blepharisma stoltei]|uniref:Cyclin N-terminal domain-containing protein n=1 Tax=Blepharisma stoltei TaxID=1481888 RepID=A0AAU9IJJ7_9CILI|nr:unnamed protein product [Blepharisma stoltei]